MTAFLLGTFARHCCTDEGLRLLSAAIIFGIAISGFATDYFLLREDQVVEES